MGYFRYIGIDPGASGGLAIIGLGRMDGVWLKPMPKTERDVYEWLALELPSEENHLFAVIEKVGGYVGGNGQPGSAMFKFGMSYGGLRMALIANGIPFDEIAPRTWQKAFGVAPRKKTESKSQFKNRLKAKAQQLFPNQKITLATADALLLAEYCRRKCEGTLARSV